MPQTTPPPTFVMPFYGDSDQSLSYIRRAVEGIAAQTDPHWQLVIVDDASTHPGAPDLLAELQKADPDRIVVLHQSRNGGQGIGRNVGIRWAASRGSPYVLFHDADDVSHPYRLEATRQTFESEPAVDFVYSTFIVIDEHHRAVPYRRLTPSVSEVLDTHRTKPVNGPHAWIRIGTETAYTTLTSTVGVRTSLALDQPFGEFRGSEDTHTWFRMSATGSSFHYLPSIPTLYRIPQDVAGSSDRARLGEDYYRHKARYDLDGFRKAIDIASDRRAITPDRVPELLSRFLLRLAETMRKEEQHEIADDLLAQASRVEDGEDIRQVLPAYMWVDGG